MADPVALEAISAFESDYYIMPSSVHECMILFATDCSDEDFLRAMVRDINKTQVLPEEFLSDNIYRYNHSERKVTIVE